nr:hypothetical protein HAGR004_12430 [Bdellovibrio sp. HAGR004]
MAGKFFLFLITSLSLQAQAEVKPYMDQMLQEIYTLKPFIVSADDYRDPKNAPVIQKSLENMVSLSEKISHEGKIKNSGFAISGRAMNQQLKEAEIVYRVGNKDYSLWMLRSTLSVCMSCHTQLPSSSTKFDFSDKNRFLSKPFDEAEFLFIVRNFDKALPIYSEVLAGFPKNDPSVEHAEQALSRKVYYFTRVKRDLPGLIQSLQKDLGNKELPEFLKNRMQDLVKSAEKIKSLPYPEFNDKQSNELRKFAQTNLKKELSGDFEMNTDRELAYLRVSSVLYKYLEQYPNTPLKPEILYWLSFCERRYEEEALYSMPELYLKQCVLEHPESKIAPACLTEYQDLIQMAFTGSSGTHIPKEVQREIESMKELIKKMTAKKSRP